MSLPEALAARLFDADLDPAAVERVVLAAS
jgi:hypothetical protein